MSGSGGFLGGLLARLRGDRRNAPVGTASKPDPKPAPKPASQPGSRSASKPAANAGGGLVIEYNPDLDGDADPGEVVWTWVTYEDDPSQGKDRPVVVIGHRGPRLVAVALTSKQHDNEPQVRVGSGPWDREGRPSFAKVDRLLDIDPGKVRREGAILDRAHFDAVVAGARRAHGGTLS